MTEPRSAYGPRAGLVRIVLTVLAAVAFVVAALVGFGVIDAHSAAAAKDAAGWLGVGLALFAVACL